MDKIEYDLGYYPASIVDPPAAYLADDLTDLFEEQERILQNPSSTNEEMIKASGKVNDIIIANILRSDDQAATLKRIAHQRTEASNRVKQSKQS